MTPEGSLFGSVGTRRRHSGGRGGASSAVMLAPPQRGGGEEAGADVRAGATGCAPRAAPPGLAAGAACEDPNSQLPAPLDHVRYGAARFWHGGHGAGRGHGERRVQGARQVQGAARLTPGQSGQEQTPHPEGGKFTGPAISATMHRERGRAPDGSSIHAEKILAGYALHAGRLAPGLAQPDRHRICPCRTLQAFLRGSGSDIGILLLAGLCPRKAPVPPQLRERGGMTQACRRLLPPP